MNSYFDNASTSFPKPIGMGDAMKNYLENGGGSYGRGHSKRAISALSLVEEVRDKLSLYFNVSSDQIIFTKNATEGLNLILNSLVNNILKEEPFAFIFISPLEHHAVTRTVFNLKKYFKKRIKVQILESESDGFINVKKIKEKIIKLNASSKNAFFVINHLSNVNGVIQPLVEIKSIIRDIPLVVDGAQSVGHIDIPFASIDFLSFTGHKGLLGPTGVGGIYAKNLNFLKPLIYGGTGSHSHSFNEPKNLSVNDFEAGTYNTVSIVGLGHALDVNSEKQLDSYRTFILKIEREFKDIKNVKILKATRSSYQGPLFSIVNSNPSDLAEKLNDLYQIETRVGLHCAPLAHFKLKSYPFGSVRFSFSKFHTEKDFEYLFFNLKQLLKGEE